MMANLCKEEEDEDGICVFWVCDERENTRKRRREHMKYKS